ncbi:hypothetical protein FB45DRAFT_790232 [Roridomyces roridus]|uniref:RING-type domain-containing protein n=1 Tax=Roridomyces roridus TaxID=1738132 RepID=A0AAD7FNS1_9AGAR|nr:hypothetical protein FB45DRAFT_790232 [Roridomyces roridus]
MAWYHAQFTTRRFNPNPVALATLPVTTNNKAPTPDALFGPPIGPVPPAPAWTSLAANTPKRLVEADELTPDTVRTWIEKSKLPSTATTTLQAQVNLRRPSLRLAPLTDVSALDGVSLKDAPHMLAFTFDCSAPQCGVHVQVLLPSTHPDAPPHGGPLKVFDAVVPGGFGRTLGATDGAVLELARFERMPAPAPSATPAPAVTTPETAAAAAKPERKRFTPFHFRRRANANASTASTAAVPADAPATGAPLAVVDGNAAETSTAKADEADDTAVRVTIRLVALDGQGRELDAPNEHTVYLAVGRLGAALPAPAAEDAEKDKDTQDAANEEDKDPDARPWLVRVVRREATIGPHTFALHEIYGLGAGAAASATPPVPEPTTTPMTYPPQPVSAPEDDPVERECLLCLSSPREVVLLPCRHLVACRPCAVNMVEFGAGGAITASDSDPATAAPAAAAPDVEASPSPADADAVASPPDADEQNAVSPPDADAASPSPADASPAPAATTTPTTTPVVVTTTTRRKRKAKGWFCPVCRQPYTSLLRITTAPPPASGAGTAPNSPMVPTPGSPLVAGAPEDDAGANNNSNGGGILGGLRRPGFLRGLSTRARVSDVEAQV